VHHRLDRAAALDDVALHAAQGAHVGRRVDVDAQVERVPQFRHREQQDALADDDRARFDPPGRPRARVDREVVDGRSTARPARSSPGRARPSVRSRGSPDGRSWSRRASPAAGATGRGSRSRGPAPRSDPGPAGRPGPASARSCRCRIRRRWRPRTGGGRGASPETRRRGTRNHATADRRSRGGRVRRSRPAAGPVRPGRIFVHKALSRVAVRPYLRLSRGVPPRRPAPLSYDPTNVFARILRGEIPAQRLHEDEHCLAFRDVAAAGAAALPGDPEAAAGAPRRCRAGDAALLGHLLLTAAAVARTARPSRGRVVVNNGAAAGQTVFHLHVHVLAGRSLQWPPG
jgi:histidine triad (HIT) family protein